MTQQAAAGCCHCSVAPQPEEFPEFDEMKRKLLGSILPAAFVIFISLFQILPFSKWIEFFLATPIVFWGGFPLFIRGWKSVQNRSLNMFTLIVMGIGASYFYSVAALFFPKIFPEAFQALYFEAASTLTVLVLLGQVLELKAKQRTHGAIRALLGMAPKTARILLKTTSGEEEKEIPLERISVGDRIRIRPGEKIPTDGIILDGITTVQESLMTGEPIPVEKCPSSQVWGGTMNQNGSIIMRAERVGKDTLLAHIVRTVEQAQQTRTQIQRTADWVSAYFVPFVLAVAWVSALLWWVFGPQPKMAHSLIAAVSVLMIACPCTLGLATPLAILIGTARGAAAGILIKNAEALEMFEKIDTLVLDKTGTLTEGKPKLVSLHSVSALPESEILRLAGSLEKSSEHPLAEAILLKTKQEGLALATISHFQSHPGQGITGDIEGKRVALGSLSFLQTLGVKDSTHIKIDHELRNQGQTVVYLALENQTEKNRDQTAGWGYQIAGLLGVADPIRTSASSSIGYLQKQGIQIIMLTGDHRITAQAVAKNLGISRIEAEILPHQKAEIIRRLQNSGHRVAMVGDGINDAPALAQAQVGIAMGTAADIAIQSAGITLIRGDLQDVVRAKILSQKTMKNIRQNLFFAFFYNLLGIPIAAGALYPSFGISLNPMIACTAMSLSSVSVIMNALRLRKTSLKVLA